MKELKLIYGEGEIKRIDKQIREAFVIISKCEIAPRGISKPIIKRICELGFTHSHSSGETFIGKRQVIKMGLFTRRPPTLKYRIPTMIYANKKIPLMSWDWEFVVAIQPKVTAFVPDNEENDWEEYFMNKVPGVDAHAGNFGYYEGEVKLFDW